MDNVGYSFRRDLIDFFHAAIASTRVVRDNPPVTILEAAIWEVHRPEWHSRAACRGAENPDIFFPGRGESHAPALAFCARCPVTAECLEYGMNEYRGVWGATSERERKLLRMGRR